MELAVDLLGGYGRCGGSVKMTVRWGYEEGRAEAGLNHRGAGG